MGLFPADVVALWRVSTRDGNILSEECEKEVASVGGDGPESSRHLYDSPNLSGLVEPSPKSADEAALYLRRCLLALVLGVCIGQSEVGDAWLGALL